nr:uncharacterized protein LOC117277615 [Nicotiana tomentosiformis]
MGIVETIGVAFTTFQLKGVAYQWWRAYETLRDSWHAEFERLCQGTMSASEYAVRFNGLSRHAPALVTIVRERVRRFIEGLNKSIRYNMARELESDTPYQQVVEIAQRLEGMRDRDREDREAKRPHGT